MVTLKAPIPVTPPADPASAPTFRLSRDRLLEMLDNFASGRYQSIAPEVVAEAARHLRAKE